MWLTNVYKTTQEYVMNAGYAMICMAIFGSIQLRSLAGGIPHFALTSSMQPTAIERVYLLSFQLVWCLMLLPFEQGRCCSFFLAQNLNMEYYGAVWSCLYCPQNLPTQKKKNEVSMLAGHRELQNQSLMLSQMPTFLELGISIRCMRCIWHCRSICGSSLLQEKVMAKRIRKVHQSYIQM